MANLLSKINIGGVLYDLKDAYAREEIIKLDEALAQGLENLEGAIGDLKYVGYTDVFVNDKAIKEYVDAQVGSINKFDVVILTAEQLNEEGEPNVVASEDTMYKLYLAPMSDAASGAYVEYITIRKGEEGAYTYDWEAIGSTKMDVTGFVTETALADALKPYAKSEDLGDLAAKNEAELNLKALAHKDSASGTVAGQTISGVKANGQSAGSITVELEQSEHEMASNGKFTPAGSIAGTATTAGSIAVTAKYTGTEASISRGDYTPAGTVSADFSHAAADAELVKGTHTPEGEVSVALSGNTFNAITGVGTQAQFTEGEFTPAELKTKDITIEAHKHLVAEVDDANETLTFTAPMVEALTFKAVDSFSGGSKVKDTFVANSLPTMAEQNVGVQSATFTGVAHDTITGVKYDKAALNGLTFAGTKVEGALVTGVTYDKADIGSATFTGSTVDINATFTGTEGDIAVAGKCHDYAVKTAEFNPADIELAVGDIAVSAKEVTVQ